MKPSDLFNKLSEDYDDDEKAEREELLYKKFKSYIPTILSIDEFVNSVLRRSVETNDKQKLYFSQKYMLDTYVNSNIECDETYTTKFTEKMDTLAEVIPYEPIYEHIHIFINIITQYVITEQKVVPLVVLEYINTLYKNKGKR